MAATPMHAAIVVLPLLLLASPQSSLVHARLMPSDHQHVHVHASSSSSTISQDMLQQEVFTAAPTLLPVLARKPEIDITKQGRQMIQVVQGSVPSPGVGHHN
ncbi:hypothetical protein BS78_09G081700 [Paspalum vaginatum]|nr:hypothetical protein BS78_09G081700 [Paspalum vaginatum]